MWIAPNSYPVGWPRLEAGHAHGYAYARSLQFYNTMLFRRWMRRIQERRYGHALNRASVFRTYLCMGSGDRSGAYRPIVAGHGSPGPSPCSEALQRQTSTGISVLSSNLLVSLPSRRRSMPERP